MRGAHTILLLAAFAAFAVGASSTYASKVALLDEVEVHDSSVFLSDLLPAQISAAIRKSAQNILIGSAPLPGADRVFEGDKVAVRLGPDLAAEISIPQQIVVHRAGRQITREEVTAAIRSALKHNGFSDPDLQPEDLRIFPKVMASSDSVDLQVRRMDFDDNLREARFLIAEPGALPFLVTARMQDKLLAQVASRESILAPNSELSESPAESQAPGAADTQLQSRLEELLAQRSRRHSESAEAADAAEIGSVTLVEPRKTATLYLSSAEMQMLLDVIPLEKGVLNQTIRVKLPVTGKVLQARVVGERRLSAAF